MQANSAFGWLWRYDIVSTEKTLGNHFAFLPKCLSKKRTMTLLASTDSGMLGFIADLGDVDVPIIQTTWTAAARQFSAKRKFGNSMCGSQLIRIFRFTSVNVWTWAWAAVSVRTWGASQEKTRRKNATRMFSSVEIQIDSVQWADNLTSHWERIGGRSKWRRPRTSS